MTELRPQAGPQEMFLATEADIAIFGGAAGGGKTWGLLMEPLRHVHNRDFGAVIFRRTSPQITTAGGLWDTAGEIYPLLGAAPIQQPYRYTFPSGARVEFHHLQLERNVHDWQGAQVPLLCYDELTHFTERQFFYLLSRNRSLCGVRPYIRATTNPDPDSWVKGFIRWWLDSEGEYADPAKAGVIRWLVRSGDDLLWFDSREEAVAAGGPEAQPKSVTFIPSSVYDNKILLATNPEYLANLMALPRVERERLERGNWKVRATAGTIFARSDFEIVEAMPYSAQAVRCWVRAASEPSAENTDPDWSAGVKMSRLGETYYISDVTRFRAKPATVKARVQATASQDGGSCVVLLFQDPAQAGKVEIHDYLTLLAGYPLQTLTETKKKYLRWLPLAAQAQAGRVKLVRGRWNDAFLAEMEALSDNEGDYGHDDQADAAAGAYEYLTLRAFGSPGKQPSRHKPVTSGMRKERF